jgi:NYN domain/OST-HTH/LOTUS domain
MALASDSVAIYWDFENLHAGLVDAQHGQGTYQLSRFRPQEEVIDVESIVEFALSLGPLAINRAFANWLSFNRYKQTLLQSAIELIQVFPPGAAGKNGADIKLCLDALDDMTRFPHIGTIIVVGGDSDYMPLSYKVKAAGRRLVGIGSRRSTNQHWAKSCHEFKFYEALVAPAVEAGTGQAVQPAQTPSFAPQALTPPAEELVPRPTGVDRPLAQSEQPQLRDGAAAAAETTVDSRDATSSDGANPAASARDMIKKALSRLAHSKGEPWVNKAGLRPYLQRMDATFHESNYGFATFSDLLDSMPDVVEIRRGEFDHEVRLRP